MEKRYQVFISSTFTDLKEERWQALRGLMSIDCIVSGMEMFPAIDQDQFEYIKDVILNCDYYLLIIGGRYGTLSDDGLSYTEKEYDFAVSNNIKVIALLHREPENLPDDKRDNDPALFDKLIKFRNKVTTGRMVDFWSDSSEIQGKVLIGLTQAIKHFPAIGWVRGNTVAKEELLTEINEIRKRNYQIENELFTLKKQLKPEIDGLASLNDIVKINFKLRKHSKRYGVSYTDECREITWKDIFFVISPALIKIENILMLKDILNSRLIEYWKRNNTVTDSYGRDLSITIDKIDFETIVLQFKVLGLIFYKELPLQNGGTGIFCKLTELGHKLMLEIRAKRSE